MTVAIVIRLAVIVPLLVTLVCMLGADWDGPPFGSELDRFWEDDDQEPDTHDDHE